MLYHAGESRHTQNSQINNVAGGNEKRVFYFMGKKKLNGPPNRQHHFGAKITLNIPDTSKHRITKHLPHELHENENECLNGGGPSLLTMPAGHVQTGHKSQGKGEVRTVDK